MARGDNPNSRKNLKPLEKGLPEKEQREIQMKGAKSGGDAKALYRSYRELAQETLTEEDRKKHIKAMAKKAAAGNYKALELILKILGEYNEKTDLNITAVDVGKTKLDELLEQRRERNESRG